LRSVAFFSAVLAIGCSSAPSGESSDASASDDGGGCNLAFCPTDATSDVPLELQVKGVIDHICDNAECHGLGGSGVAFLAFTAGNEFTDIINVPSTERPSMLRVKPGDPDNSYVFHKLNCDGFIIDACMPLGIQGPSAFAQMFHDWIEAGAPTD
jgi:hypothetical protein